MRGIKKVFVAGWVGLYLLGSGCASIMGDQTHLMTVSSNPEDAKVRITDDRGTLIHTGSTPTNVTLQKSDGGYWGGKDYTVVVEKEGYETQTIPVSSNPNGWYLAGNLVFGGLIGWFIVDPLSGAMYNLSPENINATLGEKAAEDFSPKNGDLHIVLIQDVPESLRDKMVRIDQEEK